MFSLQLQADICQLGMDQRKVNVLAREYCDVIKRKNKPIILSHHMLPGLLEGQEKMSKSDPNSAIFMEDTEVSRDVSNRCGKCSILLSRSPSCSFHHIHGSEAPHALWGRNVLPGTRNRFSPSLFVAMLVYCSRDFAGCVGLPLSA
jgi:hypothetical protein